MNIWERLANLSFEVGHYVGCRLGYANGHIYAWQGAPSTWTGGGDDLARYEEIAVGGILIPVDKLGLLAPYIVLASTIVVVAVATAIYAKCVKRRKERR